MTTLSRITEQNLVFKDGDFIAEREGLRLENSNTVRFEDQSQLNQGTRSSIGKHDTNHDSMELVQEVDSDIGLYPEIIDDDGNLWDSIISVGNGTIIEADESQLYRSYYGALGRLPDEEGFNWWLNEIREGRHDLNSMAAGFINSDEFISLADADGSSSISNEELINHIYSSVFGREPDQSGFDYWIEVLDSGEKTQSGAFIDMTQSNEYVGITLATVSSFEFLT